MLSPILKHFKSAHNSYKLCFRCSDLWAFLDYEVGVKRYFAPYDKRIASHFMLSQS